MNVLVTGGAGFLGSHLCDRLLEEKHDVWCVDDLSSSSGTNLERLNKHPRFRFEQKSVYELNGAAPAKFDRIYHLASPASPVAYRELPVHTLMTGAIGTQKVLDMAQDHEARVLFASTSEVYGDPEVHPQPETYWGNVNPVGWRSCYDEAKRYAEALVMAYRTEGRVTDSRIARIFNTYGPGMKLDDGRPVVTFIKAALRGEYLPVQGDGKQTRSFCYVDDTIEGLMMLMESDYDMPVNIGNPYGHITIEELAERILDLIGSESEIHYVPRVKDDPQDRIPAITVASRELGWQPRTDMRTGLQRTINYVREELGMRRQLFVDYR